MTAVHAAGLPRLLLLIRTNPTLGKLVTSRLVNLSPRRGLEGMKAPGCGLRLCNSSGFLGNLRLATKP